MITTIKPRRIRKKSENVPPDFNIHAISSYIDHLYMEQFLNLPEFKDHQYLILKNYGPKNGSCNYNLTEIHTQNY